MGKEDGEFWMSFDDFKKHYTDFEICSITVDQMYEDDGGQWVVGQSTSYSCSPKAG